MYQASSKFGEVILNPNRVFNARLLEKDQVIVDQIKSFSIISGCEEITLGNAIASYVEISIEAQDISLSGREVALQVGVEVDGIMEYIPMGIFTIQNPKKESNKISFTAYDRLASKCNAAYYSKLTYPVDALDILSEIEQMVGIQIDKTGLSRGIQISKRTIINDEDEENIIQSYVNPFDGYTYKETIGFISGLFGKFAVCGRTGVIELRWYADRNYKIGSSIFYNDLQETEENFVLDKIICDTADATLVSGSGPTGFSVQNPVMTQSILDDIFKRISGLSYIPSVVRFIGDIRLDIGDIVTVIKNDGTEFIIPAISLNTSFDGGLMQIIGSYGNTAEEDDAETKGPIVEMIERVSYDMAFIKTLMVDNFTATNATIKNLSGDYAEFKSGEFEELKVKQAQFESVTTNELTAIRAKIDDLDIGNLDADYAKIDFANVDTAVIRQGFMENLMVSQGIFTNDITAAEGTFTNYLTGVNILANNINAGTLSVERLIITGSDKSIVYEINKANGTPQLSQETVDGGSLTERTISADRIVAETITGTEIAASTITGQHIVANSITAASLDVNSIFAQDITATGTITGANLVGATGTFTGNITATSGTIGGFKIDSTSIRGGVTSTNTGGTIALTGNATGAAIAIAVGADNNNRKFTVKADGSMTSTSAVINNGTFYNCNFENQDSQGVCSIKIGKYDDRVVLYANGTENRVRLLGDSGVSVESKGGYVYSALTEYGIQGQYIQARDRNGKWSSLFGLSSSNNIYVGTNEANTGVLDTNIYSQWNLSFFASRGSASYKSTQLVLHREQSGSHRTLLRPNTNGGIYLGSHTYRYNTAFFTNAITASDLKEKSVLDFNKDNYIKLIMGLNPISYRRTGEGDSGKRIHMGLGAQDVNNLIDTLHMGDMSIVQAVALDEDGKECPYYGERADDENLRWGLNYTELIAPIIYTIQDTRKELKYQTDSLDQHKVNLYNLQKQLDKAQQEIEKLKQILAS